MVERLKTAIEKARAQRAPHAETLMPPPSPRPAPEREAASRAEAWDRLRRLEIDDALLEYNRIVSYRRSDPSSVTIDMLRTRISKVCAERGWRRIAVTSPTQKCGKSTLALNLAFSFARQPDIWAALVDVDLRRPSLSQMLGQKEQSDLGAFLSGAVGVETAMARAGERLAVGLNRRPVPDSAELGQSASTQRAVEGLIEALRPDVVLFDLPPILAGDDAIGFMAKNVDCAVLVAAAGQSRAKEIAESERLLGEATTLLGVVLNKVDASNAETYGGYYDGAG